MTISKYEQMNTIELDVLKEIGSIGTGNAATALASLLSRKIEMTIPDVSIMGYNEAMYKLGGPERIVVGVMSRLSGDINGIMLYIQEMDFINVVLENLLSQQVKDFNNINEMEVSALIEIGNIIISSYINALTGLAGVNVKQSVPGICINMLGAILSVPMVEFGYETDKIMTVGGKLICDNRELGSNLILVPEIQSLNYLFERLGITNG